jgi:hypothetical protein
VTPKAPAAKLHAIALIEKEKTRKGRVPVEMHRHIKSFLSIFSEMAPIGI